VEEAAVALAGGQVVRLRMLKRRIRVADGSREGAKEALTI